VNSPHLDGAQGSSYGLGGLPNIWGFWGSHNDKGQFNGRRLRLSPSPTPISGLMKQEAVTTRSHLSRCGEPLHPVTAVAEVSLNPASQAECVSLVEVFNELCCCSLLHLSCCSFHSKEFSCLKAIEVHRRWSKVTTPLKNLYNLWCLSNETGIELEHIFGVFWHAQEAKLVLFPLAGGAPLAVNPWCHAWAGSGSRSEKWPGWLIIW